MFLFLLIMVTVFALWLTVHHIVSKKRFQQLVRERTGLSICEFARSFDYRTVDTKIIRAVYVSLQDWATGKNFPVLASDDLGVIYGIVGEDLDYFAEEIATQTGRKLIHTENNPFFNQVKTAKDLVLFLNHQPKASVWKSIYI